MAELAYARTGNGLGHLWLHRFVFGLDRWLQKRASVIEFSTHPDCIFRVEIARLPAELIVGGGYRIAPGDRLLKLHLWNEHIPLVPAGGATLAWARKMGRCFETSLYELATWLSSRPDLADVALIYACAAFGTLMQSSQIVRISRRYGFENAAEITPSSLEGVHQFGENLLISLMVFARNPFALRRDSLRRGRVPLLMSRECLMVRYGSDHSRFVS